MSRLLRNGIPRTEDGKIDFSWKNHYGFTGLIVLLGFLFPPLAVAVRFGIGRDFFINVLLTICGIIPGHLHNWFIQNVRNNDTKARTPRWAIRYGLVDDRPQKKLDKKRAWTGRFNDRLPPSQRVVYDDEGVAHVVEEPQPDSDMRGVTAPWNTQPLQGQRTGLVEPDQWINKDPSQPEINYNHQPVEKRSKLARFSRSKPARTPDAQLDSDAQQLDRSRRRSSLATSSDESFIISTPEQPTRATFESSAASAKHLHQQPRRQDDIFAHEF
ncbi:hypothetical protein PANT_14c00108 [Moesziomyces antarcticus T-34]|uniref:Uncharacterized protein n=1 Tax=Pseudozyma antarctica (strain T-34) TaxID=1151754 RepID=M9MEE7_PSEA3|nr:hypothetical protein PANT_14c00108 [Moesziomyces antarcticus T-34]